MRISSHFVMIAALVTVTLIGPHAGAGARLQTRSFDLQGEVKDQNGAVIPGAKVNLADKQGFKRETTSNEQGRFRLSRLPASSFTLSIIATGFSTYEAAYEIGENSPQERLSITLYPDTIKETVIVANDGGGNLDAGRAAGTQTLNERELEALPDDPDQFNEQLQTLATSSGSAPGGATVTVDGFLTGGKLPPKSAIREVRVNPDLFSAEYDTPPYRGGRIEIFTKPGAEAFRGSAFFQYNSSALNARNAFAQARTESQTHRYGVQVGAPLVRRRSGFFLDLERRDIEEEATTSALTLDENLRPALFNASVLVPLRLFIGSIRADWQINPTNTFIARYDLNTNRIGNQGVGGFNLPERATNYHLEEQNLRFSLNSILSPRMLNELRIGLTKQAIFQEAVSNESAILVLGAFSAGGALAQLVKREERRLEIVDNLTLSMGQHSLKLGAQIYGKSINDLRAENTNGTFLFGGGLAPSLESSMANDAIPPRLQHISGLEQYRRTLLGLPGGVPTRFTITSGAPNVNVTQWLFAGFVQDEWRVRSNLALNLGLRYEGQTAPFDAISLAPRIGLSYSPDKEQRLVVRARAGIFYDRIDESLTLEALRLDGFGQQQLIFDAPSFPDPFIREANLHSIATTRRPLENLCPPASLQLSIEVERHLPRGWRVSARHSWTRGWNSLRSRNINAPVMEAFADPALAPRPLGFAQNVLQFESSGRIAGRVLFIGLFQSTNKRFTLSSGYLNFDFRTNADTPFLLPQSSYDEGGEWARPFWMARHRLFLISTVNLPLSLRASLSLNAASGTPFNITTGRDNNGDGNLNDRPVLTDLQNPHAILTRYGALDPTALHGNLPRNAGTNPSIVTLDLNLARTFAIGKGLAGSESRYKLAVNARANNLLNRANLLGLNGVLASPFFGRANASAPARRIEVGLRFSF
jgi:hypothetical protein